VLSDVVRRVADSLRLPVWIWPTPVVLMRGPVRIMEAIMKQPLSTRAQLAMLVEGLDGDPAPARSDLNLITAPFTVARIEPLLSKTNRKAPFSLRFFSAPASLPEITGMQFWMLLIFAVCALTVVFSAVQDRWMGMSIAMGITLGWGMLLASVRRRLKPSLFRIAAGLAAGAVLYGITLLALAALSRVWTDWETSARTLYAWRAGHSPFFIGTTLVMIVLAEEVLWRGVVARYLIGRHGRAAGIVYAAVIYALAHIATFNPILLIAALGCGLYWGWLAAATDDLVTPAISHLLWDILLLFVLPVVR